MERRRGQTLRLPLLNFSRSLSAPSPTLLRSLCPAALSSSMLPSPTGSVLLTNWWRMHSALCSRWRCWTVSDHCGIPLPSTASWASNHWPLFFEPDDAARFYSHHSPLTRPVHITPARTPACQETARGTGSTGGICTERRWPSGDVERLMRGSMLGDWGQESGLTGSSTGSWAEEAFL